MNKYLIFILFLIYGATVMATPIQQQRVFTQVEHPELVITKFLAIENLSVDPENYKIRSPIQVNIHAILQQNTLNLTVTLRNTSATEWFLPNFPFRNPININDVAGTSVRSYPIPTMLGQPFSVSFTNPKAGSIEPMMRYAITDDSFNLLSPGEVVSYQLTILAKEFYDLRDRQPLFIEYIGSGVPPSILEHLERLRPGVSFRTVINSNKVSINCYDYDREKKLYLCDIDNDA